MILKRRKKNLSEWSRCSQNKIHTHTHTHTLH